MCWRGAGDVNPPQVTTLSALLGVVENRQHANLVVDDFLHKYVGIARKNKPRSPASGHATPNSGDLSNSVAAVRVYSTTRGAERGLCAAM